MDWLSWRADRLVLRRFREDDAEALAAYRSDPEVARHQSWNAPYPLDAARALAGEMDVAFSPREHEPRIVEVGFSVAPALQGRGLGTEAVSTLLEILFGRLGKPRACSEPVVRPAAGRRRPGAPRRPHRGSRCDAGGPR